MEGVKVVKREAHGMYKTKEYKSWQKMKERCNNPKSSRYHRYGGRNIKVCERWNNSFIAFFEDMGLKPFPEAQLDREKNNLGYFKENCRWISPEENSQNRSTTKANPDIVRKIRKFCSEGVSQASIARYFELSTSTVNRIVLNLTWKNVCN